MQLAKLKIFEEQCRQDLLIESAISVDVFYFHENTWRNTNHTVAAASLGIDLSESLRTKTPLRRPKSKTIYFPVAEISAVVCSNFTVALKRPTYQQITQIITRSFKNASNAFEVEYHQLTGLLGKKKLVEWLVNGLTSFDTASVNSEESTSESSAKKAVAVISIDIDFFKQVNDNYGHSYGDIVLRAFAMRLEEITKNYLEDYPTQLEAVACHASGEEFFCLARGNVENSVFIGLAEAIRSGISNKTLPDKNQLEILTKETPRDSITIPAEILRNITCSLGLVVSGPVASGANELAKLILKQSDLALYRAKALGRNKVVEFSTILGECGRVLENRDDVGLIVIDIGKEVGVSKGQEFRVFHPDGGTPFIIDDGRSKKILGIYPPLPIAEITVIETQAHIAFCRQSENSRSRKIPVGACLEAVPLGSIGHLFSETASYKNLNLAEWIRPENESKTFFQQEKPVDIKILILKITNQSDLIEKRGFEFINRTLAGAIEGLKNRLPKTVFAGIVETTEIVIVINGKRLFDASELLDELDKISGSLGQIPIFSAGIFTPFKFEENKNWMPNSYEDALFLARYAATYPQKIENNCIEDFSPAVAARGLLALRNARAPIKAMADFERFRSIGLINGNILNIAGLIKTAMNDAPGAVEMYLQAYKAIPENYVIRLNLFIAHIRVSDYSSAEALLTEEDKTKLITDFSYHIAASISMVHLLLSQARSDPTAEKLSATTHWIERIGPHAPIKTFQHWKNELSQLKISSKE